MVFKEATLPVQCNNDPIWSQQIPLKDSTKNPLKKNLYLLDTKELKELKA